MPAKDRRLARLLTTLATGDPAPAIFLKDSTSGQPNSDRARTGARAAAVSTAQALIEAARQCGKLDELATEARAAAELKADKKVENAETIFVLVELARGQGAAVAPRIDARIAEMGKEEEANRAANAAPATPRLGRLNRQNQLAFPWTDYLVAKAALDSKEGPARDAGLRLIEKLIGRAQSTGTVTILPQLRLDHRTAMVRGAGSTAPFPPVDAGLAHWHAACSPAGEFARGAATPAPCFLAQDGVIAHLTGSGFDHLLFDYPIAGSYEFSVDAYLGWFAESGLVHGGLVLETSGSQHGGLMFPVGGSEAVHKPLFKYNQVGRFNRIVVQATPQKVRYLLNGHVFHEDDDPSPTSPWLGLSTKAMRDTAWRNISISGSPVIPREVKLTAGDRLEGWDASFYFESQPPRRTEETTDQWGNVIRTSRGMPGYRAGRAKKAGAKKEPVKLENYDWAAQDGVIHGRRQVTGPPEPGRYVQYEDPDSASSSDASQSILTYFRPLRNGDTISYEFLYEPDQVVVHPTLGRIAFLLEPDGVKVHWLTTGKSDLSGISTDNAAVEPANRRGPGKLGLKSGEWNAVKLALEGDKLTIALNGQPVYERPLERELSRQFGLFHYKDRTSAQARNVVLKGRWPESVSADLRTNLIAPSPAAPSAELDRRAWYNAVGENFHSLEAGELVDRTRALPPEARYRRLAEWVLPSPDHSIWRLAGDFSATYPPPTFTGGGYATLPARSASEGSLPARSASEGSLPARSASEGSAGAATARIQTGGELRSPAIDLIDTAQAIGKLDELLAKIQAIPLDDGMAGKQALEGLIAVARGDEPAATKVLAALTERVSKRSTDSGLWQRFPELSLVVRAAARPALHKPALALANAMAQQLDRNAPSELTASPPRETWLRQVKHHRARLELLALADQAAPNAILPFGSDPKSGLWARVSHTRSQTRGESYPLVHWNIGENTLTHYPGHDRDLLYLAVPLRGDFELDFELTFGGGRMIRAAYGGVAVGPKDDLKALDRSRFSRPRATLP